MKDRIMELLNLVSYNRYALENKRDDLTYLFPVITPMDGCPKRKLKPCYEFFREKMFPLIGSSSEADYSMEEIRDSIIPGTHGITKYENDSPYKYHRPVPSARGFHPCELYILSREGLKRFDPVENSYDILAGDPEHEDTGEFQILVAADDWRLGKFYGNFAYVLCALDAGHIIGQICVLASKFRCYCEITYDVENELKASGCLDYFKDNGLVLFAGIKIGKSRDFNFDGASFQIIGSRRICYKRLSKKLSLRNEILALRELECDVPNTKRALAPMDDAMILNETCDKSIGSVLRERSSAHSHIGLMSIDDPAGLSEKIEYTEKGLAEYLKYSRLDKYINVYVYINATCAEYNRAYYRYDNKTGHWVQVCEADDSITEWYRIIHDNHEFLNVESIPLVFFFSTKIDAIRDEYGNRLIDVMYMFSGEISQIICLLMTKYDWFCRPIKNINEEKIETKLMIDNSKERITYAALAGKANIVQHTAETGIFEGRFLNE